MAHDEQVEILLVEDNPDDVELTLRALDSSHLANRVHVVGDGVEALARLRPDDEGVLPPRPRLILLDLKLPRVSGLEVLRQLKASPATQSIPVVVLTSSLEERDLVESYRLGVNSYIVKPVDFDQFMAAVREVGLYWLLLNKVPE